MSSITVVLPTYNRAAQLRAAVASVLQQTFRDLELLVIDDASTDGTADAIAAVGDPRLRYIRLPTRSGVSRARNHGIGLAKGDWIAFQDSDDEWLPDKLDRQLAAITPETVLVVTRDRVSNDPVLSYAGPRSRAAVIDITAHAAFRLPPAATWLARRESLLAAGGFDSGFNCYEDWELGLRLAPRGRIRLVNAVLVARRRTADSLFSSESSRLLNLQAIMQRHGDRLARDPLAWSYYANALGQMLTAAGRWREGRRWFWIGLQSRPWDARAWINLLMSSLGTGLFVRYVAAARSIRGLSASLRQARSDE